mmetsp:Transcript_81664/g.264588  ORF Transcript_81664/g.264588 Transcript_81664/m.264588 type:complete len:428 (+) Transcript_81664:627-1910(+)
MGKHRVGAAKVQDVLRGHERKVAQEAFEPGDAPRRVGAGLSLVDAPGACHGKGEDQGPAGQPQDQQAGGGWHHLQQVVVLAPEPPQCRPIGLTSGPDLCRHRWDRQQRRRGIAIAWGAGLRLPSWHTGLGRHTAATTDGLRKAPHGWVVEGQSMREHGTGQRRQLPVQERRGRRVQACMHQRALILQELAERQHTGDDLSNRRHKCRIGLALALPAGLLALGSESLSKVLLQWQLPEVDSAAFAGAHVPQELHQVRGPALHPGFTEQVRTAPAYECERAPGRAVHLQLHVNLPARATQRRPGAAQLQALWQERFCLSLPAVLNIMPHVADRLVRSVARGVWLHKASVTQHRDHLQQGSRCIALCCHHLRVHGFQHLAQRQACRQRTAHHQHVDEAADDAKGLWLASVVWNANHHLLLSRMSTEENRK